MPRAPAVVTPSVAKVARLRVSPVTPSITICTLFKLLVEPVAAVALASVLVAVWSVLPKL